MRTITAATKSNVPAVAVAGADIDPSLAANLSEGDKVMMEVNGMRLSPCELKCPLVAARPWLVLSNNPPRVGGGRGERPQSHHTLVLSHPDITDHCVTLHYNQMLTLPRRQPAVFQEYDANLSNTDGIPNPAYVVLQLFSHFMPAAQVNKTFQPWDEESARLVLEDADLRLAVLSSWSRMFEGFTKGWGLKSVYRFAMRAFVKPSVVHALRTEDWRRIDAIDLDSLLRIHEAIHWLPYFTQTATLRIERDTIGEPADENENSNSHA